MRDWPSGAGRFLRQALPIDREGLLDTVTRRSHQRRSLVIILNICCGDAKNGFGYGAWDSSPFLLFLRKDFGRLPCGAANRGFTAHATCTLFLYVVSVQFSRRQGGSSRARSGATKPNSLRYLGFSSASVILIRCTCSILRHSATCDNISTACSTIGALSQCGALESRPLSSRHDVATSI